MRYKKIIILTFILTCLLAVSAVSAANNATDDVISADASDNVVSVGYDNETVVASEYQSDEVLNVKNQDVSDVNATESNLLTAKNNNVSIATYDNNSDVLTVENNDVSVMGCDGNGNVLTVENSNVSIVACDDNGDVLTVENNNEPLTFGIPSTSTVQGFTNYKTFTLGTLKLPIKYLKFDKGYKPSKKNKKLWKQYKSYKKYCKKALKKFTKQVKKVILKATKNHWHSNGNPYVRYHVSGKYIIYTYYQKAYRRYNYNWITNKEWWD